MDDAQITDLTATIVCAYVSNNSLAASDLPALISETYKALAGTNSDAAENAATGGSPSRAFTGSIRASIKRDRLISMIDGMPYKLLVRHLKKHGYTPESYRATFGLPADYPMVAPGYGEVRRELAIRQGLGRKPSK